MTLTITATNKADLLAQVADLTGATPGTGTGTGGGTTPPPTIDPRDPTYWDDAAVQAKFFPTDFTKALYPSPERTEMVFDVSVTPPQLRGAPYIKDVHGNYWTFKVDASGNPVLGPVTTKPPQGGVLMVNNINASAVGQLKAVISQGEVYMVQAPGGQLQKLGSPGVPGSGTANTQLPIFWSDQFYGYKQSIGIGGTGSTGGGSSGGSGGVPMPPDPPAQTVAYGATGKVIQFGPDQTAKTIAAALAVAMAGDVVRAAPSAFGLVYAESFDIPDSVLLDCGGRWANITDPVNRHWTEGAFIDGTNLSPAAYSHGLGGVIFAGNGKLMGAHVKGFGNQGLTTGHDGTAGLRAKGSCVGQIQGDHLYIENCQNGIGPGGTQINSGPWTNTVIVDCGLAVDDGGAHNVYDSSNVVRTVVGPNFFSSVKPFPKGGGGHAYKTRASAVTINGPAYFYSGDSSSVDIPDGTAVAATIASGVVIEKKANDLNHSVFGYGPESTTKGAAGVKVAAGATIIANCQSPNVFCNGPVDFAPGVVFQGGKITNMGSGTMTGA